jgi:hypothetical protein
MRIAQPAQDFDAFDREAVVGLCAYVFGGNGRVETGPASAGIELG